MESAELIAILREVRERVKSRYPTAGPGAAGTLPDLEPLVRARDAAAAKVAAIGTVNPRRGGPLNAAVQGLKRLAARALDWHVREQVLFNRKVVEAVDAAIEALAESNRAMAGLQSQLADLQIHDIRAHWAEWRAGWERKLAENEIQFLRSVADLQRAFAYRADLMDANYRDALRSQHADFTGALARGHAEIQKDFAATLERMKLEYERTIHSELRLIRQRLAPADDAAFRAGVEETAHAAPVDFTRFAERFRGPEEAVKAGQRAYVGRFAGKRDVLDIGCGRGEFLELMREAGVPARGIELNAECAAMCRAKGLDAQVADLFEYLAALPENALDGIFCAHVVEHLEPMQLARMVSLCASRLMRGGVIAMETPNPECLAIFGSYFYLDPTHVRPVPRQLLEYYFAEGGIGVVEFRRLAPAVEHMPAVAELPEGFREAFFGGLDYGLVGVKVLG
ncbi:MAG TPA: class I SAM-dependent methyltransferase [Bryobacteraceae bacterium]|nr:class I SAM-dependent methyltransferase [Bryobacteraceae bacterium]